MGHVRFQIGVPRAGSAAHQAEQEDRNPGRIALPRAGSSALASEQEKASRGAELRPQTSFSLRGQNGTVTRNATFTSVESNRTSVKAAALEAHAPMESPSPQSVSVPPPQDGLGDHTGQPPAGPMKLAASRFQTLVRSLFSPGDTSGKS